MRVHFCLVSLLMQVFISCNESSVPSADISNKESIQVSSTQANVFNFLAKDVPLGARIELSTLDHYNYYGQFLDDGLLDFYTAEYPGFVILSETPETVVLEYNNGILVQKRYSFTNDIFERLNDKFLKHKGIKIKEETKIINMNFTTKRWKYIRIPPYFLYETIKKD